MIDGAWLSNPTSGYLPDLYKGFGPSLDQYASSTTVTVTANGSSALSPFVLAHGHTITTVAGTGVSGWNGDGAALTRELNGPYHLAIGPSGAIFFADMYNHRIRQLDGLGNVTTIAGTGIAGFNGDGVAATTAQLSYPTGVALDSFGNVYVSDAGNRRVRKINVAACAR